jgi:hypothetical protein
MPYDHAAVARQIAASQGLAEGLAGLRETGAEAAARLYHATPHDAWCDRVTEVLHQEKTKRWIAQPLTPLHTFPQEAPLDETYTVVATDSSYIPPDKHRGVECYLINVGRVMLHYGAEPRAELDSLPLHHTEPLAQGDDWMVSGRVLQAQCAVQEIAELCDWAVRYEADLALLDGSLMQLGLALRGDETVQALMADYLAHLDGFEHVGIPIIGYVSKPASQMVMHGTRVLGCRAARQGQAPCEKRCKEEACAPLWTIDDAALFWHLLAPGERSPVFQARSSYGVLQQAGNAWERMGFCYLATAYEIARLEFPLWVAEAGHLDRVHRLLLRQCYLGDGYPKAITLADQQAVLRAQDRESYYFLLERAGLIHPLSEKARGKQGAGRNI